MDYLKDKKNFICTVKYFTLIGEKDRADNVRDIAKQILDNETAENFNWQGRGGKRPFSKTRSLDVITSVIVSQYEEAKNLDIKINRKIG